MPNPPRSPRSRLAEHRSQLGRQGEQLAADHLVGLGLRVVARNWRIAAGEVRGELDVVALDEAARTLVVCEVKTRRDESYGGPLVAVTPRKQARIRVLTAAFLRETGLRVSGIRFDVIGIVARPGTRPEVRHVRAAF